MITREKSSQRADLFRTLRVEENRMVVLERRSR